MFSLVTSPLSRLMKVGRSVSPWGPLSASTLSPSQQRRARLGLKRPQKGAVASAVNSGCWWLTTSLTSPPSVSRHISRSEAPCGPG